MQSDIACMIALQRSPFPVDSPQDHAVIAPAVCLVNMVLTAQISRVITVRSKNRYIYTVKMG